jgi:hypothetical protein
LKLRAVPFEIARNTRLAKNFVAILPVHFGVAPSRRKIAD